jgi:hypothetical protein
MNKFVVHIESSPTTKRVDVPLRDAKDLVNFLDKFIHDGEGAASITRNDDDFLLLGVEGSYAFVHYDPQSRGGDYLWLSGGQKKENEERVPFNVGGTETEIPKHRCVSVDEMRNAALHFFEKGELPRANWEVDDA